MKKSPRKTPCWWYVSFSGATELLGAAFVRALSEKAAVQRAKDLKIHPADVEDILCLPIPQKDVHRVPVDMRNRLLTEKEIRKVGGKRVGE